MIQLRYTSGVSPWVFIPVKPKQKNYTTLFSDVYHGEKIHTACDWRHLFSYLLGNKELAKVVYDRSKEDLRRNVATLLFKAQYTGIQHSDLYIALTDNGTDKAGIVCGNIESAKIWKSMLDGFEVYLKEQIENNKPTEFSFSFRYTTIGVAKRETQDNTLWAFRKERESRKQFDTEVEIEKIFV